MRLSKFLQEDVVQDALGIGEPEVGKKYPDDVVAKRKQLIQQAIKQLRSKGIDDDAKEAMMADLVDKQDKWENVEKETALPKPPKPPEKPGEKKPEGEGEQPPSQEEKPKEEKPKEEKPKGDEKSEPDKDTKAPEKPDFLKKKKKKVEEKQTVDTPSHLDDPKPMDADKSDTEKYPLSKKAQQRRRKDKEKEKKDDFDRKQKLINQKYRQDYQNTVKKTRMIKSTIRDLSAK